LFAFPLLGIALAILTVWTRKDPTPGDVADRADRILSGIYGGYEVDAYEHLNPKNAILKELWEKTLSIHPLPEEWAALDEAKKGELRKVIREIRQLPAATDDQSR
jgi:hypothetical protein